MATESTSDHEQAPLLDVETGKKTTSYGEGQDDTDQHTNDNDDNNHQDLSDQHIPDSNNSNSNDNDNSHRATPRTAKAKWEKISHNVCSGQVLLRQSLYSSPRSAFGDHNDTTTVLASKGGGGVNEDDTSSLLWNELAQRRERVQTQIRNGVEFNLTQCLAAIFLYIAVAVLAFSFVLDHWTLIDSIYFVRVLYLRACVPACGCAVVRFLLYCVCMCVYLCLCFFW